MKQFHSLKAVNVTVKDEVIAPRIRQCFDVTIPSSIERCYETGRIEALKLNWQEGKPNRPHIFWDSDVAKVLEGMAYSLQLRPDAKLEAEYDKIVDLFCSVQQPDGYLNSYFAGVAPEQRWSNIYDNHELYCAGHLIEAAVAGYTLLGKRKLLDAVCRYADYIDQVFGKEEGKKHGYPGHQELELALVRLYEITQNERYLKLAKYFIDERGTEPNYFVLEGKSHTYGLKNRQAHIPVREQSDADGHAVRALYMYSAMADLAGYYQDEALMAACRKLFDSIANRRMYITGGVGSTFAGEAFTVDYDLTNGSLMYAESCAAIALALFARRMDESTGDGKYFDVAELSIFNGILSGISLSGDHYFYTNYLEVDDNSVIYNHGSKTRQPWFDCSCCPTNFCRFLPEIAEFVYAANADEIRVRLPIASEVKEGPYHLQISGNYPYDGNIKIAVKKAGEFTLALRIPGWCKKFVLSVNGKPVTAQVAAGYVKLRQKWQPDDEITLVLEMPIEVVYCHPKVTVNAGRVALKRGPVVYCIESTDNPAPVRQMLLQTGKVMTLAAAPGLPAGTLAITGEALAEADSPNNELYHTGKVAVTPCRFTAIPYALWQNRGPADMAVWVRRAD